jgi:four helix bundle protein
MPFKFEKLEVWGLALAYIDSIYEIAEKLPKSEEHNLKSQIIRAATSVSLNIAEGSIGQTDVEQARFLGLAIRSLVETVACQHIISRRKFLTDPTPLRHAYRDAENLVAKLHALRKSLVPAQGWLREDNTPYHFDLNPLEDEES